jgi:hypothetical protein
MKQLLLSQKVERPMRVDLMALFGYREARTQHPRYARRGVNRLIELRGENRSRAFAGADSVRPYFLKSKAPFFTA